MGQIEIWKSMILRVENLEDIEVKRGEKKWNKKE